MEFYDFIELNAYAGNCAYISEITICCCFWCIQMLWHSALWRCQSNHLIRESNGDGEDNDENQNNNCIHKWIDGVPRLWGSVVEGERGSHRAINIYKDIIPSSIKIIPALLCTQQTWDCVYIIIIDNLVQIFFFLNSLITKECVLRGVINT